MPAGTRTFDPETYLTASVEKIVRDLVRAAERGFFHTSSHGGCVLYQKREPAETLLASVQQRQEAIL